VPQEPQEILEPQEQALLEQLAQQVKPDQRVRQARQETPVQQGLRERLASQDQQGRQVILAALARLEIQGLLDKQARQVLREAREQRTTGTS